MLAPTTGETTITSQTKIIKYNKNKHASLTKKYREHQFNQNKLKPGLVASYDLRPGNGVGPYSGR